MSASNPHDTVFHDVFAEPHQARAFFQAALPSSLVQKVQWESLRRCPDSFTDNILGFRVSDLMFKVDSIDGELTLVFLFEHQSTDQPRMSLRCLIYMGCLWHRAWKDSPRSPLTPIIPVVLYHGKGPWTGPLQLRELFVQHPLQVELADYIPDYKYHLYNLRDVSEDSVPGRPLGQLLQLFLKTLQAGQSVWGRLPQWMELLVSATAESGREAVDRVLGYVLYVDPEKPNKRTYDFLDETLGTGASEALMTGAQQLREEGRQEGLLLLLKTRFGVVKDSVQQRVRQASQDELTQWMQRIFTASSPEDLLR